MSICVRWSVWVGFICFWKKDHVLNKSFLIENKNKSNNTKKHFFSNTEGTTKNIYFLSFFFSFFLFFFLSFFLYFFLPFYFFFFLFVFLSFFLFSFLFGQRPWRGRCPVEHRGLFFNRPFVCSLVRPPQPWGSYPSLKAQIPAWRPKS